MKNSTKYPNRKNPHSTDLHGASVLAGESGIALVATLLLMIAMITIIPVAMHLTANDGKKSADFRNNREAFFIADAGIQMAGTIYQENPSNEVLRGPDKRVSEKSGTDYLGSSGSPDWTNDNGIFTVANPDGSIVSNAEVLITGSSVVDYTSPMDGATHKYTQVNFNGGNYKVRIFDNDDSDLCPVGCSAANSDPYFDTDNEDWVDRDGVVYIESIGTADDGEEVTVAAMVRRKFVPEEKIPAAVVLVGPKATVLGTSANYRVSGANAVGGNASAIDGTTDPDCSGKGGISIEAMGDDSVAAMNFTDYNEELDGAAATELSKCEKGAGVYTETYSGLSHNYSGAVCVQFGTMARKNIQGVNKPGGTTGTGKTAKANPDLKIYDLTFTAEDAADLYEDIITNGTDFITLPNPAVPSNVTNWGTPEDPVVLFAPGDLNMTAAGTAGTTPTGYGILVVNGNLNISSNFIWNGILLLNACSTCTGGFFGTGTITINGTVIVGNSTTARSIVSMEGTTNFNYSCEGIAIATGALKDSYRVAAWNEINP